MKNALIVVAHPDDEVLLCGGTAKSLIDNGWSFTTCILGEGATSRNETRDLSISNKDLINLQTYIKKANTILGINSLSIFDFPDNRFDTIALLDITKTIEKVILQTNPSIIFTHSYTDLNIDHKLTHKAVLTATRPLENSCVKEIYCGEILSSTEWSFDEYFKPDTFFDISKTIDFKIDALKEYKSEIREYPHPRSIDGIKIQAQNRALCVGKKYVEAFETIRRIVDATNFRF